MCYRIKHVASVLGLLVSDKIDANRTRRFIDLCDRIAVDNGLPSSLDPNFPRLHPATPLSREAAEMLQELRPSRRGFRPHQMLTRHRGVGGRGAR